MTKDVFCIMTGEHILHVVKKERVEKSLSAWKGSYKDARAVPAEETVDTSNPVIEQVKELLKGTGFAARTQAYCWWWAKQE